MSSIVRSLKKKTEIESLRRQYGKTARMKCPQCHQLTLFKPIEYGKVIKCKGSQCVRCNTQFNLKGEMIK